MDEKGLAAKVMDFYQLDFPKESFDCAWAMNSLLHIPKNSLGVVLSNINAVLKPQGLFYMGVYGGNSSEGIWEEDSYTPKRFFSFYDDEDLLSAVSKYFDVVNFEAVCIDEERSGRDQLHYQSLILRKKPLEE